MRKEQSQYIVNVCLVPDESTKAGRAFVEAARALSQHLNCQASSLYEIGAAGNNQGLPHCTIGHVVAPSQKKMAAFGQAIGSLLEEEITLLVRGMTVLAALGKWERRVVAARKGFKDPTPDERHDVIWAEVRLTQHLREQQTALASLVEKAGGEVTIKTPHGDRSNPHFTLWVNPVDPYTNAISLPSIPGTLLQSLFAEVPCMVAIGDVGPHGQVRRVTTNPRQIVELSRLTA